MKIKETIFLAFHGFTVRVPGPSCGSGRNPEQCPGLKTREQVQGASFRCISALTFTTCLAKFGKNLPERFQIRVLMWNLLRFLASLDPLAGCQEILLAYLSLLLLLHISKPHIHFWLVRLLGRNIYLFLLCVFRYV